MFFKDVNIADTTKTNAANQTASANRGQAIVDANRSSEKSFDTSRHTEGRANADFWQRSKQNLKGVRNVGNGSNTAADLGQAFSVMEGAGDANTASTNANRVAQKAARSVNDFGFAQSFKTGATSLDFAKDIHDAQNKIELQNGTLNAIQSGIDGAVSGFKFGNEAFNKGGWETFTKNAKQAGQNWKDAVDGNKTLTGTLGSFRDLNQHYFNGGVDAFKKLDTNWGGR